MNKRFFKFMGISISVITIAISLLLAYAQPNEQDPPGLGTLQVHINK